MEVTRGGRSETASKLRALGAVWPVQQRLFRCMRPRRCHHTGLRMVVRFVLLSTAVGLLALAAAPYVDRQHLGAPERCSAVRKRLPARAPVLHSLKLRCVGTQALLATPLDPSGSILQSCLTSSSALPAVDQPGRAQGVPAIRRDRRRGRRARLCAAQVCRPSPRALDPPAPLRGCPAADARCVRPAGRNGTPTATLRQRVRVGVDLYAGGRVRSLVFSGGHPGACPTRPLQTHATLRAPGIQMQPRCSLRHAGIPPLGDPPNEVASPRHARAQRAWPEP